MTGYLDLKGIRYEVDSVEEALVILAKENELKELKKECRDAFKRLMKKANDRFGDSISPIASKKTFQEGFEIIGNYYTFWYNNHETGSTHMEREEIVNVQ